MMMTNFRGQGIILAALGMLFVTVSDIGTDAAGAVDGGWSEWSVFITQCTKTCGGGTRDQSRSCTNPAPSNGGKLCLFLEGNTTGNVETRTVPCNTQSCYVGIFGNWTECANCTLGIRYRESLCGNVTCNKSSSDYFREEQNCNRWNKTVCPSPCIEKADCPKFGNCEDISTDEKPLTKCVCTMGYQLNDDKTTCVRPAPVMPTPKPIPTLPPAQKTVATVVSKSASSVIIAFVSVTLALFLILRIFTVDRVIQMNMEIALLCAHVLLLYPPELTKIPFLCKIVSVLIHFCFMACYIFMMLEALHMYFMVAYVVKKEGAFTRLQNVLIGWGLAAIIVLFCISFAYQDYGGEYHCWLQLDKTLAFGTFVPVIIFVITTFTLIEAAGAADYKPLTGIDKKERFSAQVSQRTNLIIIPFVIAHWSVGMFSEYEQNLALYGIFSVLNGITGFLVFFLHCSNNQQVRDKLKKMSKAMFRS